MGYGTALIGTSPYGGTAPPTEVPIVPTPPPAFSVLSTFFTASNNEYATSPTPNDRLKISIHNNAMSFGCWFKMNSAHNGILFSRMDTSNGITGWSFEVVGDERLIFDCFLGAAHLRIDTTSEIIVNAFWHHALLTLDGTGTAAGARIYHNGALAPDTDIADTLGAANTGLDQEFQIGDREFDQGTLPFDGHIDDMAWWGKELSAGEALTVYDAGRPGDLNQVGPNKDLIVFYRMGDDDTFPTIKNVANNDFPSDATISIEMNNGTTDEEVDFGDFAAVDFADTDSFTLGCWVRIAASVASQTLVRKATGSGTTCRGYIMGVNASGQGFLDLRMSGGGARRLRSTIIGDGLFDVDAWMLMMAGYNGDGTVGGIQLWVNGNRSDGTTATVGALSTLSNSGPLVIGRQGVSFADELKGFATHSFIINKLISDQEARMIYGSGKPQDLDIVVPGDAVWHAKLGNGDTTGAGNMIDIIAANNGVYTNGDLGDFQSEAPARSTALDLTMTNMSADDFVSDVPG